MAADADRRRLLLAGDAEGNLVKLYSQVETQQKKVGQFDALLAVGAFLPATGDAGKETAAMLAEYVSGARKAPIDTFFIDSKSATFLQVAPDGKQLCERINFLGGCGLVEIKDLTIAFLSGSHDPEIYKSDEANEDGPLFVGSAYTQRAVKRILKLAKERGSVVDILLTAEWPMGLEERLDEADKPTDPDGKPIDWLKISSRPVAELCSALEPRYHIFGTGDIFYQRAPFQTKDAGHVCRCIGLGRVITKGKGRAAFHGLALSPATTMPETALKQRPANTTPSPFQINSSPAGEQATKRDASALADEDPPAQEDTVFLSKLPANIEEKRLAAAFKHVGKVESVRLAREEGEGSACKGFGWVQFSSPDEAQAACDLSELLECGGRKIAICISRPKARADGTTAGPRKKKREIQIVIEPHSECWFCLVNPKVEKHMIVTAATDVYVATARGPINPYHLMVLPVKHAPCFAACPPELQQAMHVQVHALRKMFADAGQECLVWERWIPMGVSAANHMQIQVLPLDQTKAREAKEALEFVTRRQLQGATLKRASSHSDILDHMQDDATTPYVYFELPGDLTAKGRQIERYFYAAPPGGNGPRIPVNFGRQVACHLLGCDDKVDWRSCQDTKEGETKLCKTLRELFKPFQAKSKSA
eukprot:TRINITY_DN22021_c0_g1_i2.p1 TRINITY_DN22021_c0_g1~~TRINITY_DN22021_c0_g1_i2.p1  ORF type:complete len:661 (-),score=123.01 TRINITY_DN22021_c0_g1_i2:18-1967(-)